MRVSKRAGPFMQQQVEKLTEEQTIQRQASLAEPDRHSGRKTFSTIPDHTVNFNVLTEKSSMRSKTVDESVDDVTLTVDPVAQDTQYELEDYSEGLSIMEHSNAACLSALCREVQEHQ